MIYSRKRPPKAFVFTLSITLSMPDSHIDCPYCAKKPNGSAWFAHILSAHSDSLFDKGTTWGKKNLAELKTVRKTAIHSFYFKNDLVRFCCLKCKKAVDRPFYAKKHEDCIRDCNSEAQSILETLKQNDQTPPSGVDTVVVQQPAAVSDSQKNAYLRLIYEMTLELRSLKECEWAVSKLTEYPEVRDIYDSLNYEDDDPFVPADYYRDIAKVIDIEWETLRAAKPPR